MPIAAPQATVTLKQIAAGLAESDDLSKKQAEAMPGVLVAASAQHGYCERCGLGSRSGAPFGMTEQSGGGRLGLRRYFPRVANDCGTSSSGGVAVD